MHDGTDWNVAKWQVVTRLDVGAWAVLNRCTLLEIYWSDDVTLLAISKVK